MRAFLFFMFVFGSLYGMGATANLMMEPVSHCYHHKDYLGSGCEVTVTEPRWHWWLGDSWADENYTRVF